jgi:hypothetical protein
VEELMSALDASERERCRYHLGYLNVQMAGSIQFGLPRPVQTLFIVEEAMTQLIADGVNRVRRLLKVLDDIECRLISAQDRLAASALGELKIERQGMQEPDLLEKEYYRWGGRLADQLGVPFYAYSNRYKNQGGTAGIIPVRG